jgi:hypothetical protein
MSRFSRSPDPDRPGQLLLQGGEPVAIVYWAHDFAERDQTGWFLTILDDEGEPDGRPPQRLEVSGDVAGLIADDRLERTAWLARAEAVELVSAAAALEAGERRLEQVLDGHRT